MKNSNGGSKRPASTSCESLGSMIAVKGTCVHLANELNSQVLVKHTCLQTQPKVIDALHLKTSTQVVQVQTNLLQVTLNI